jgi:hypothetical protein
MPIKLSLVLLILLINLIIIVFNFPLNYKRLNPSYIEPTILFCIYNKGIRSEFIYDTQKLEHLILNSSDTIKIISYSIDKKYVLWLENDKIKKGELILENNLIGINKTEVLVSSDVSAFTLDSVQHLVYYFDRKRLQIIAFDVINPQIFEIIINKTKENVGDMEIDPINHYLFWSEWDNTNNSRARIMRSNQDGSHSMVLPIMADLREPSIMTIDHKHEKLYFIDKSHNFLGSLDYFGNYKPVIPYDEEKKDLFRKLFHYAYSLDIFRDTIFWSSLNYVFSIPENGDLHNLKKVMSAEHDIDCLTIFDPSRQPYGQNHCANNNCCGLCLPTRKNFKCALNQTTNKSLCEVMFQTNKKFKKIKI